LLQELTLNQSDVLLDTNNERSGDCVAKLEGKIAVITGGTSGIGLATAKRFVAEGAFVYITGRRKSHLETAVKEIGKNVIGVRGDVSDPKDLELLFEQIKREKGKIDTVFANAGTAEFAPLGSYTDEHFDLLFNANVRGLVFTVQKSLPLLVDGATIVLTASIVGSKGFPNMGVYNASKAAVRSFARTWTSELKDRKIRVNAVSPGTIDTPAISHLAGSPEAEAQFRAQLIDPVPLGRMGHPDEIAKAVVFLASDDSSYVAGVELFVDGGMIQV
jgi:NAD(P)-dependent dehydrogenase (short-subunit alcohol dehydrogenase family)